MINKIFKKTQFIINLTKLGAGLQSKFKLFFNIIIIQFSLYFKTQPRHFTAQIGSGTNFITVNFLGTMDELHALTEIFIEECYKPNHSPKTIIDMGANIGLATIWFKLNYPEATIHAYEPNPYVYKILEKNTKNISDMKIFNEGISSEDSFIEFNISERSFSSSTYPISNSKKIKVKSTSFDTSIVRFGGVVDLIKIDIEGAEFKAIINSNKLNSVFEIIGEIHPEKSNESLEGMTKKLNLSHKVAINANQKSLFHAIKK